MDIRTHRIGLAVFLIATLALGTAFVALAGFCTWEQFVERTFFQALAIAVYVYVLGDS